VLAISQACRDKIVAFEVGNRAYYEKFAIHPVWPGGMSGVTIGIGYDLGQHSAAELTADWAEQNHIVAPLLPVCGLKGDKANAALPSVIRTAIPYDAALNVFTRTILPRYIAATEKAFSYCDLLPQDAFGALVDLVFNRGGGMDPRDARRSEMVLIGKAMATHNFKAIPGYLRSMKRLWPYSMGLQTRREWEATTFEHALAQGAPIPPPPKVKSQPRDLRDTSSDVLNERELERVRRINYGTGDPLGH
jgi:hypothetical protein